MKKNRKKLKNGFTLVELLVVITILVTVGGIVVTLLYISLRGNNKSETVTSVKQNGTFALSQMVKSIRYAKSLTSPASCTPTATTTSVSFITYPDNGQITYSCPTGGNLAISSNSASLIDTNAVEVTACSFVCTQTSPSDSPRLTIQFTLQSRGANALTETQSTIPFQSSVIMRNIIP